MIVKLHMRLVVALLSSVLAISVATAADHEGQTSAQEEAMNCEDMGHEPDSVLSAPVVTARNRMDALKGKLKITKDQGVAWQAFYRQVNAQAENRVLRNGKMYVEKSMPRNTPELMAMETGFMKEMVHDMENMTNATETFYATLTPDQKNVFDSMHMSQLEFTEQMKYAQ